MKHGPTKEVTEEGDIVFCIYNNGKKNGPATIKYSDGRFFKGTFKNDLYDGLCILKPFATSNSIVIELRYSMGEIRDDTKVKIQYSNGEIYLGTIKG